MFENAKKEKAITKFKLWERELEVRKKESMVEFLNDVALYRKARDKEIVDLAKRCANDTKDYEHTFHSNMEKLGNEIAKLEAKKEALSEIINQDRVAYELSLKGKDAEIKRLNDIILKLVAKEPSDITVNNNR